MDLYTLCQETPVSAFLVDASGVIHASYGYTKGISETLTTLQSIAPVFLATNNSYFTAPLIVSHLKSNLGVILDESCVISSGHGLCQDLVLMDLVQGKRVFVVGNPESLGYVQEADILGISSELDDCDCLIFMSSSPGQSLASLSEHIAWAKSHPECPVICCNPDRIIASKQGPYPVVGQLAADFETAIGRPLHWFGKPFDNYSAYVRSILEKQDIIVDERVFFFDDILANVRAMEAHLGVSGVWIRDTGVSQYESRESLLDQYGSPCFSMEFLGLHEAI